MPPSHGLRSQQKGSHGHLFLLQFGKPTASPLDPNNQPYTAGVLWNELSQNLIIT